MKPKSSGLAPDTFIKQIENGQIPTVVCIVGEEPYYRDLARRTLLDAIFTDTPPDSRDITVFEEKTNVPITRISDQKIGAFFLCLSLDFPEQI